ncbi:hypothetical protein V8E51_011884 [Hyaloscypha variabilis]
MHILGNLAFGHIYNDYNFLCKRLTEDLNQELTTKDIEDLTNPLAILDYWTREYTCPYRPYITPFETATKIPENEKTLICESASQLSAIPEDGRIDFALTSSASESASEPGTVNHLESFANAFQQLPACAFFVADLDPFYDRLLRYKVTGSNDDEMFTKEYIRGLSREEQKSRITATYPHGKYPFEDNGHRLFAPLIIGEEYGMIEGPWRRIIFLRGLGSMFEIDKYVSGNQPSCPYFQPPDPLNQGERSTSSKVVRDLIAEHLRCDLMGGNVSQNPYHQDRGFHVVFFETIKDTSLEKKRLWKFGNLFHDANGRHDTTTPQMLRRSSFSAFACSSERFRSQRFSPFYTVLLLVPDSFFTENDDLMFRDVLYSHLKRSTLLEAELFFVLTGLSEVVKRWSSLDNYLSTLMVEDFMEPKSYSNLLFDDENFSRSRKYFWLVGCLTEFDITISDNIQQWDLYFDARLKPLLEDENLADNLDTACLKIPVTKDGAFDVGNRATRKKEFEILVKQGQNQRGALENIRTRFKNKLDTVKTLRDGLFNASALVESRASTRLGQNVKLLTYVSIFYLPLAFCAALWAIPNIQDKATKIPFIVTAILVGFITYAIVFNMDFMTNKFKVWYLPRRQNVVGEMQKEPEKSWWQMTGERFEEFKPSSESHVPTEWWIPFYVAHQALVKRTWTWTRPVDDKSQGKPDENKTGKDNQIPPATIQAGSSSVESHPAEKAAEPAEKSEPAEEPELAEESGPAIAKSSKFISLFRSRKNKESVPGPATV